MIEMWISVCPLAARRTGCLVQKEPNFPIAALKIDADCLIVSKLAVQVLPIWESCNVGELHLTQDFYRLTLRSLTWHFSAPDKSAVDYFTLTNVYFNLIQGSPCYKHGRAINGIKNVLFCFGPKHSLWSFFIQWQFIVAESDHIYVRKCFFIMYYWCFIHYK